VGIAGADGFGAGLAVEEGAPAWAGLTDDADARFEAEAVESTGVVGVDALKAAGAVGVTEDAEVDAAGDVGFDGVGALSDSGSKVSTSS